MLITTIRRGRFIGLRWIARYSNEKVKKYKASTYVQIMSLKVIILSIVRPKKNVK